MFPESVRSAAGATFELSLTVAQKVYRWGRPPGAGFGRQRPRGAFPTALSPP